MIPRINGLFISIEGMNGVGKTYVMNKLKEQFDCVFIEEFTNNKDEVSLKVFDALNLLNKKTDIYYYKSLPYTSTMLIFSLYFYALEQKVTKALDEKRIVVSDRSIDSPSLLQSIIINKHQNNFKKILSDYYYYLHLFKKGIVMPSRTFVLVDSFEKCIDRIKTREGKEISQDELIYLKKTYQAYKLIKDGNRIVHLNKSENFISEISNYIQNH
jgi:thymidylate kinase